MGGKIQKNPGKQKLKNPEKDQYYANQQKNRKNHKKKETRQK